MCGTSLLKWSGRWDWENHIILLRRQCVELLTDHGRAGDMNRQHDGQIGKRNGHLGNLGKETVEL